MIQVCFTIISFDVNLPAVMGHFELIKLQANTPPKRKKKKEKTQSKKHAHRLNFSLAQSEPLSQCNSVVPN